MLIESKEPDIYTALYPYKDKEYYFIHLTGEIRTRNEKTGEYYPKILKIGINPYQDYKVTPIGIYAYPLKDIWNFYNITLKNGLDNILFPDDPQRRTFVYLIKAKNIKNCLNVATYTTQKLSDDLLKIQEIYDNIIPNIRYKVRIFYTNVEYNEKINKHPYLILNEIIFKLAALLADNSSKTIVNNKIIIYATSIYMKLNYEGIYDPGTGLFCMTEPYQIVFFSKKYFDVVPPSPFRNITLKDLIVENNKKMKQNIRHVPDAFYSKLLAKQEPLGKEFERVLHDNLSNLYVRT